MASVWRPKQNGWSTYAVAVMKMASLIIYAQVPVTYATITCPGFVSNLTSTWNGVFSLPLCTAAAVPLGTRCDFSCNEGYEFYSGAVLQRTCQVVKGVAQWNPLFPFGTCHEKRCKALPSPSSRGHQFTSQICHSKGVKSGESCLAEKCPVGSTMVGPHTKSCNSSSAVTAWTPRGGTYCKENGKTLYVQCPEKELFLTTEPGKAYADGLAKIPYLPTNIDATQWNLSIITGDGDNLRQLRPGSYMLSADLLPALNADAVKCSIKITVKDKEPPSVEYCPLLLELAVPNGEMQAVRFLDRLRFKDNIDGTDVEKLQDGNITDGMLLGVGSYNVLVKARDKAKNVAICQFKIEIKGRPCFNPYSDGQPSLQLQEGSTGGSNATTFYLNYNVTSCPSGYVAFCKAFSRGAVAKDRVDFDVDRCEPSGAPRCVDYVMNKMPPGCVAAKSPSNLTTCDNGMELISEMCVSCPSGTVFNATTKTCKLCADNTTASTQMPGRCSACPVGTMTKLDKAPRTCEAICPPGQAFNNGTGKCAGCPPNAYAQYAALSCTPCGAGMVTLRDVSYGPNDCVYGASTVSQFDASSFNVTSLPMNITTFHIGLNVFLSSGSGYPLSEVLAFSVSSAFLINQTSCDAYNVQLTSMWRGFVDNVSPRLCGSQLQNIAPVPYRKLGKFVLVVRIPDRAALDVNVHFSFVNCLFGTFFNKSMMACNPCPVGSYQPTAAQHHCAPCPASKTTLRSGATVCIDRCAAGFRRDGDLCSPCSIGTYREKTTDDETMCRTCPPNTTTAYPKSANASLCLAAACVAGKFANGTQCNACPRGTYQDKDEHASPSCKLCPKDMTTIYHGSRSKQMCIKKCHYEGEFYDKLLHECKKCPTGTYKYASDVTATECSRCAINHTTKIIGAVTPLDCFDAYDHCSSHPCHFPGRCVDVGDTFKCVCPMFYGGAHCEIDTSPCAKLPCANNDTCVVTSATTFHCECRDDPATGKLCKTTGFDHCTPNPCQNNGVCTSLNVPNSTPSYKCQCPLDYSGSNCEIANNTCARKPCHHLGSIGCIDLVYSFRCHCIAGYKGEICSELHAPEYFLRIVASVKFIGNGIHWRDDLVDSKSVANQALKSAIETEIQDIYGGDKNFFDVIVTSFRRGSVIANITIYFYRGTRAPLTKLMKFVKEGFIGKFNIEQSSFKYVAYPGVGHPSIPRRETSSSKTTGIAIGVAIVLLVIAMVSVALWWNGRRRRTRITFDRIMNDTTHLHPNIELS